MTEKDPWWKDSPDGYEVLDPIIEEGQYQRVLSAAYTPSNGIRIGILHPAENEYQEDESVEFDFEPDQAKKLGEALLRWAAAHEKEFS